jgi:hypothetical protein
MPAAIVYSEIRRLLSRHLDPRVREATKERLAVLVLGIIQAASAAPAHLGRAVRALGLSGAKAESIERRIRRLQNDAQLTPALCFHAFARYHLALARASELWLILDPTTKEDDVVLLSASVWYRGRALPLAWAVWPANVPLEGPRLWQRVALLLDEVERLLPLGVPVTWLADCAFGTPQFTDLVAAHHWHYVVRVQDQTRCRDRRGVERSVRDLVRLPGQRAKLRGLVFKKRGWREASVIVHWGRGHDRPLCLVSDRPPRWWLIRVYRRRYAVEASFRDYKSQGWRWEQGQVRAPDHVERLLLGMALATWIALLVGTQVASEVMDQARTGRRRSKPAAAKQSLFSLGLQRLREWLGGGSEVRCHWRLTDYHAPNWETQLHALYLRGYVFAPNGARPC